MRFEKIVRRVAHIDAEDIGARHRTGRPSSPACWKPDPRVATILVLRWRLMRAFSGSSQLERVCVQSGDLPVSTSKKPRRSKPRLAQSSRPGTRNLAPGRDAEMGLAFPSAAAPSRGVEIIVARLQRSGEKPGAALGRHRPPALAGPIACRRSGPAPPASPDRSCCRH